MKASDFKNWFSKREVSFNVLLDEGGKVLKEYGIRGYPTSVFINTDGTVEEIRPGDIQNESINEKLDNLR